MQADQRLKQNQEDLLLLAHPQGLYLFVKEYGLMLNQELNPIKRTQWQKCETLFFGRDNYLEKMGRSNSGDRKMIFGTHLSTLNIGLTRCGRARWQEAEATRKDFNFVLTRQDKFFNSELFKVIQDAIPLIQSVYTAAHIQDYSGRTKFKQGETDGILYSRESHEKRAQRSTRDLFI